MNIAWGHRFSPCGAWNEYNTLSSHYRERSRKTDRVLPHTGTIDSDSRALLDNSLDGIHFTRAIRQSAFGNEPNGCPAVMAAKASG